MPATRWRTFHRAKFCFLFPPDATSSRFLSPGFPLASPAYRVAAVLFVAAFNNLRPSQPLPRPLSGGPFGRHRWTSPTRQHPSAHAPNAARGSPANPFLESPADSGTHAPNLQRLRQAGDARQDLVRISESTTKCGDCGEESGGDAEVSRIRGESGSPLRV